MYSIGFQNKKALGFRYIISILGILFDEFQVVGSHRRKKQLPKLFRIYDLI